MSTLKYNDTFIEVSDLQRGEEELDTLDGFPGYQATMDLEKTRQIDLPVDLDKTLILKKEDLRNTGPISIIRESHHE